MTQEHDAFRELTGLYALGALDDERQAMERHLETCDACAAEVRSLRAISDALPFGVPQIAPPLQLRQRILEAAAGRVTEVPPGRQAAPAGAVRASAPRASGGWWAAAASLVVAGGMTFYAATLRSRVQDVEVRLDRAVAQLQASEERLQASVQDAAVVRSRFALVTAADALEFRLAGQPVAPQASARAFLSRSRGVLLAASNLPPLPAGRTYQLWYLTRGAPVSAGLMRPDAQGNATATFEAAGLEASPTGLAISLEPEGGVPAPTGALYLVGD